jgi:drug/metabolite transporter (DMT)-like permease
MGALSYMAISATLFAFMNFFAKLASSSAGWASVAAVRALIGGLVAFAIARARGASLVATDKKAIFWRSILGTAAMLTTFYSLSSRNLGLGDTVTLLNLMPVFLAVLAPIFLGERTVKGVILGIVLALSGVVLVVRPTFIFGDAPHGVAIASSIGPSAGTTAAFAVLSAFLASIAMMLLRRVGQTESAEAISVHFSAFAFVVLSVVALFDLRVPNARDVAFMFAAGICGGLAQIAMTRAYSAEQAARVSAMSYLSVVASAILGAVALRERPPVLALVGMILVVGGGVVVTFAKERYSPPP